MTSWKSIAWSRQAALLESIPAKWRLTAPLDPTMTDVRSVPRTCGLLTLEQLRITEQTATELLSQLHSGSLTAVQVVEAFCARAAVAHQCVNCLTAFFYEEALARAAELDEIFAQTGKPIGPLHGLPIAIKDIINVKGKPATMGLIAWHDKVADEDASLVTLLRVAGAVPFAMTTMPQTGMMLQTVSNLWGRTLNPYNTAFSAGGSSGGDGSLVAMRGSPTSISTDIGGSIRAPAAFNGLYGIRPTADRIPRTGLLTTAPGQISIKVSCGPVCHSVADLKLGTRLLVSHHDHIGYEPSAVPMPWRETPEKQRKLCFGIIRTDGCVTPQPPIVRSLNETVAALEKAGHQVIDFEPPVDLWELNQTLWKLYWQTGAAETKAVVASAGEPLHPNFIWYQDTFAIKALTVPELFQLNAKQSMYKRKFAQAWQDTKYKTASSEPIDGLICPCAPSASFPHDFPVWWGYFGLWNLLDYPSTILPLHHFKVDQDKDAKDLSYVAKSNVFDKMNWEIYDPQLWKNLPVCIQIVRPPFTDEELLSVTEVVDQVCNGRLQ